MSDVPNILLFWTNSVINCFDELINVLTGGQVTSFFEFLFQYLLAFAYLVVNGATLTIECLSESAVSNCFSNYPEGSGPGMCVLNSQGEAIGGLQTCIGIINSCLEPIPLYAPLVNTGNPNFFQLVQDLFAALDIVVCAVTSVVSCFTGITCDPSQDFPACIQAIDDQLQCVADNVPPLTGFMNVLIDVLNALVIVVDAGQDAINQINSALAAIQAIIPFKRSMLFMRDLQNNGNYSDITYFRNSWKEYLQSKNISDQKRCGKLIYSCCLFDVDMKAEGKNVTTYNRCMILHGNGLFSIWPSEFGYEMHMLDVLAAAKADKNYVPCKLYPDYPLDPIKKYTKHANAIYDNSKNETFAYVFNKTISDIKNSTIVKKLNIFLKEASDAKQYYMAVYRNDTLALAAHKSYVDFSFNDTWYPIVKGYQPSDYCVSCHRKSKVKYKSNTSLSKSIVTQINKDVFTENNTKFINDTYTRFNALYDLDHWKSVQLVHMLYYSADNYEKSEIIAWMIGRKKYLVEKGFVDSDHYEEVMKDRIYVPRGSLINLVCGDDTLRNPQSFGPFLVINNLTTYFPPLPTTMNVLEKALNRSKELHATQTDNYNFNQAYLNALSAVFNFILGLFIEISLDIWSGIVSIFTSLADINYQTFFFNTVGNYLINLSTCEWPLNVNGSTIYNPFCAILIPENVMDWVQLPPTAILVVQIGETYSEYGII